MNRKMILTRSHAGAWKRGKDKEFSYDLLQARSRPIEGGAVYESGS